MKKRVLGDTVDLFSSMESGTRLQLAPTTLLRSLSNVYSEFEGFHQQDCPEMLHVLLSTIDDATHSPMRVANLPSAPRFVGNGKCLNVYDLMQEVNLENERKERAAALAQGKEPGSFFAPMVFRSGVTDLFKGYALNEVTCGNSSCGEVSRVIEAFSSLAVEIPSTTQRLAFAKQYPHLVPREPASETKRSKKQRYWWNPIRMLSFLGSVARWVFSSSSEPVIEYPLTLNECLGVHFMAESLGGSNMYKCDKCLKKTVSTKKLSILKLPQELLIQIKRFEYGRYWTHKRSDDVLFPMTWEQHGMNAEDDELYKKALDLSPFIHPLAFPLNSEDCETTLYTLRSTATHHGSFGGGHYTAYVHKGRESGWVLCNDARLQPVEADEVGNSQGYVLLLSRQRIKAKMNDATEECQRIARLYLSTDLVSTLNCPRRYVSRMWLLQCALVLDPGCMLNKITYTESASPYAPSEFYVPMRETDATYLLSVWGGDNPLTEEEFSSLQTYSLR